MFRVLPQDRFVRFMPSRILFWSISGPDGCAFYAPIYPLMLFWHGTSSFTFLRAWRGGASAVVVQVL